MAEPAQVEKDQTPQPKKSNVPMLVIGAILVAALLAGVGVMLIRQGPETNSEKTAAEYQVPEKMYQLQDGSYLKLAFSLVIDEEKLATVAEIIENTSPGRLPASITLILGNKTRDDLINGMHKREAFARELKKTLEDRVFGEYNRRQTSSQDTVEVREVLISDFVTQSG
jgi:flagellar basal body-associated protein FliL